MNKYATNVSRCWEAQKLLKEKVVVVRTKITRPLSTYSLFCRSHGHTQPCLLIYIYRFQCLRKPPRAQKPPGTQTPIQRRICLSFIYNKANLRTLCANSRQSFILPSKRLIESSSTKAASHGKNEISKSSCVRVCPSRNCMLNMNTKCWLLVINFHQALIKIYKCL